MHLRTLTLMMLAMSVCLGLSTGAVAAPVVVETHVFDVPLTNTPWTETAEIPQYNPADHGGMALAQVDVTLKLTVEGDVTFNGDNTTVKSADAGGTLTLQGPGAIDESVVAAEQLAPPEIVLVSGQPVQMDVMADDEMMFWFMDAATLAASTGAGTVDYDLAADGSLSLQIVGGNISIDQNTAASARLTVEYKAVPEPASLGLLLIGAVALLGFARKP